MTVTLAEGARSPTIEVEDDGSSGRCAWLEREYLGHNWWMELSLLDDVLEVTVFDELFHDADFDDGSAPGCLHSTDTTFLDRTSTAWTVPLETGSTTLPDVELSGGAARLAGAAIASSRWRSTSNVPVDRRPESASSQGANSGAIVPGLESELVPLSLVLCGYVDG